MVYLAQVTANNGGFLIELTLNEDNNLYYPAMLC